MTAEPAPRWIRASPADPPTLDPEAVHVWRVRLDPSGELDDSWELLSDDERK